MYEYWQESGQADDGFPEKGCQVCHFFCHSRGLSLWTARHGWRRNGMQAKMTQSVIQHVSNMAVKWFTPDRRQPTHSPTFMHVRLQTLSVARANSLLFEWCSNVVSPCTMRVRCKVDLGRVRRRDKAEWGNVSSSACSCEVVARCSEYVSGRGEVHEIGHGSSFCSHVGHRAWGLNCLNGCSCRHV